VKAAGVVKSLEFNGLELLRRDKSMTVPRRTTIKEIAREAGVSVATVSRVINGRPDVSAEMRDAILKIMKKAGFQPSNSARSLIRGRSLTLGIIGFGMKYYGPSSVIAAVEERATHLGYSLALGLLREPSEEEIDRSLQHMLARDVDGIVYTVPSIRDNQSCLKEIIVSYPIPIVFVSTAPDENMLMVDNDNRQGGLAATSYLIRRNRRKIAIITGPLDWWAAKQRLEGYQAALEANELPYNPELVIEGNWSPLSGERGMQRLFQDHPDVDAVFASNDQMALGVLKAARASGRRVPDDLAVVGYDDIPESSFFCPALTTMRQDFDELGYRAVDELVKRLDASRKGEQVPPPENFLVQSLLIERDST
jgi:LacI family transcriptional regulator